MSTGNTLTPTPDAEDETKTAPQHSPFKLVRIASINVFLAALAGLAAGTASALFLWALDQVTLARFSHPALVLMLPAVGVLTVFVYKRHGGDAARGNDLIIERIQFENGRVPLRMAPLIFGSTLLSHLCGASTGREGAAVQMAASISSAFTQLFRLPRAHHQLLLVCGIAAGFGSIFGTPLAGAVFAIEVPAPNQLRYRLLPFALISSLTGNMVAHTWGATHAQYPAVFPPFAQLLTPTLCGALILTAVGCGWTGALFVQSQKWVRHGYQRMGGPWWLPPVLGSALIIMLSFLAQKSEFLGLGTLPSAPETLTISTAFSSSPVPSDSWIWKLLFTCLSLSSGFKGGEVTPLFFMGAMLGHTVGGACGVDPVLTSALGFVAVFAGASHTPIAGLILGIELFGLSAAPWFAPVCWLSHFACGRSGLYACQKRDLPPERIITR